MDNQNMNVQNQKDSDDPQTLIAFLTYMKDIKGISRSTMEGYRGALRTFLRFLSQYRNVQPMEEMTLHRLKSINISHMDVQTLGQVDLNELHAFLLFAERTLNNSASHRANKVTALKAFYRYLTLKAKLISNNPTLELESPKIPKRQPRFLTLEESRRLLQSIKGPFHVRDYAIITLFLNCGMRRSELIGIDLCDIRDDTLTVLGKGSKERTIYLNQACQLALKNHLKERLLEKTLERNALFLGKQKRRISSSNVYLLVKSHLVAAGLDTEKYSPHKLRHTAATLMYIHGGVDIRAIQEILGHTKITTTEIYTHLDEKKLREAADRHPMAHLRPEGRKHVRKKRRSPP